MWLANIVSQLVVGYFISYKVSLSEEMISILLKSKRSILSSVDYAFGVTPKRNWTCKWLMATPSFSCQGWPCHPVLANRTCSCKRSFNVSCYGCSAPSLASSIYLLGVRLWYSCCDPGIGYILGLHSGKLKTMHLKKYLFYLLIFVCVGSRYGMQDLALQCVGSVAAVNRFLTVAHRLHSAQAQ